MGKRVIKLTVFLTIIILSATSCMRGYRPDYSRIHAHGLQHPGALTSAFHHSFGTNQPVTSGRLNSQGKLPVTRPGKELAVLIKQENHFLAPPSIRKDENQKVLKVNPEVVLKDDAAVMTNKPGVVKGPGNVTKKLIDHIVGNNQLLCAVVAFFIPPLGVILAEDAITIHFWIDLILTLLFWLPGFIYALIIILS